jgi:hypothetical protein
MVDVSEVSSAFQAQSNDRGTSASMAAYAIYLHQLSLIVALRRSPSACVGSPFGSLHPIIRPSLGYINLAAPTGRRPSTFTALLRPGQSPPAEPSPRPQRHQTAVSRPASWFKSVPLTDDRPPSVRMRRAQLVTDRQRGTRRSWTGCSSRNVKHRRGRSAKDPPLLATSGRSMYASRGSQNWLICTYPYPAPSSLGAPLMHADE